MIKPIRIYLDSSDFSNLSRPKEKDTAAMTDIRSRLLTWVKDGVIEIRYSMAHIMEAVPVDPDTAELGRRRLGCIEELCGQKAFVDPVTLVTQELSGSSVVPLTNELGHWFPTTASLWGDDDVVASELPKNRHQRRIERKKAKSAAVSAMSQIQEMLREFPIKKSKALAMFSKPQSAEAVATALQESVNDLEFLCDWYIKNWGRSTEYSKAVRNAGQGLSSLLRSASDDVKAQHLQMVGQGLNSSEAQKLMMTHARAEAAKVSQDMVNSLSNTASSSSAITVSLESMPSMYVFSELLAQIFLSSVVAVKNTRKARDSDLIDMVHAMYIPYVDIFRADLATASALQAARLGSTVKIVTSLDDLVNEVEAMIVSCQLSEPVAP